MKRMLILAAPILLVLASSFTPIGENPKLLHDTRDVLFKELSAIHFKSIGVEAQFRSAQYSSEVIYNPHFIYSLTTAVDDKQVSGKLLVVINKTDKKVAYLGMSANLHNIPEAIVRKSIRKAGNNSKATAAYNACMCDCMVVHPETPVSCLIYCILQNT